MFGNHTADKIEAVVAAKSKELGKTCIAVLVDETGPNGEELYTVGVPIKGISGKEFKEHLLAAARNMKNE